MDTFVWVDNLAPGQVHRAIREEHYPGGKGVHVALAARELGCEVRLFGIWAGPTGWWIREQCHARGIECGGPEIEGWSRACLTLKSEGSWNETELLGRGPEITKDVVQGLREDLRGSVATGDWVSLSGSWPDGAPATAYANLIDDIHAEDAKALLDCTGKALVLALEKRPHTVHLNAGEAAALLGPGESQELSQALAERCEIAVVTAASDGAYATSGDERLHARCEVSEIISAVGSGDCLLAGLAVAGARGQGFADATRLAVACGAANCLREELGMMHRRDVESLTERVELESLP